MTNDQFVNGGDRGCWRKVHLTYPPMVGYYYHLLRYTYHDDFDLGIQQVGIAQPLSQANSGDPQKRPCPQCIFVY